MLPKCGNFVCICITHGKASPLSANFGWFGKDSLPVIEKYTKFANFASVFVLYFAILCNETWQFYWFSYTLSTGDCGDRFRGFLLLKKSRFSVKGEWSIVLLNLKSGIQCCTKFAIYYFILYKYGLNYICSCIWRLWNRLVFDTAAICAVI